MKYEKMTKKELIEQLNDRDEEIKFMKSNEKVFLKNEKVMSSRINLIEDLKNQYIHDLKIERNDHTENLVQREEERKEMEEFMNRQSEQIAVAKEVIEALEKTIVRLNLEETMRRGNKTA